MNQDVLGCFEISINVIFKHVEHVRIIWTEKVPGAEKIKSKNLISFSGKNLMISFSGKNLMISFSVHGGTEKYAGLLFATWVSA